MPLSACVFTGRYAAPRRATLRQSTPCCRAKGHPGASRVLERYPIASPAGLYGGWMAVLWTREDQPRRGVASLTYRWPAPPRPGPASDSESGAILSYAMRLLAARAPPRSTTAIAMHCILPPPPPPSHPSARRLLIFPPLPRRIGLAAQRRPPRLPGPARPPVRIRSSIHSK